MVLTKKRKKPVNQDFKRVKAKVGRRVDKNNKYKNVTDTSFRAKSINLNQQIADSTTVKVKITKLLPLTTHHNSATRASALKGLSDIVSQLQINDYSNRSVLPLIVERARECVTDEEKVVRVALVDLLKHLLEIEGNGSDQTESTHWFFPFVKLFVLHVCAALNSLSLGKRLTALTLMDILLIYFPATICKGFEQKLILSYSTLLNNTIDDVGSGQSNNKGINIKSSRGHADNKEKKTNKAKKWHRVASSFRRLMDAILAHKRDMQVSEIDPSSIKSDFSDFDKKTFYCVTPISASTVQMSEEIAGESDKVNLYEQAIKVCSRLWIQARAQFDVKSNPNETLSLKIQSKRDKKKNRQGNVSKKKQVSADDVNGLTVSAQLIQSVLKQYLNLEIISNNTDLLVQTRKIVFARFPLRFDDIAVNEQSGLVFAAVQVNSKVCEAILDILSSSKQDISEHIIDYENMSNWLCRALRNSTNRKQKENLEILLPIFLKLLQQACEKSQLHVVRNNMLEGFNDCFIESVSSGSEVLTVFVRHLDSVANESLKYSSEHDALINSMEGLLLALPRVVWQLAQSDDYDEQDTCNIALRVLLKITSGHTDSHQATTWEKVASTMTPLFYVQTKSQKKILGPFLQMNISNQRLILQILTMIPTSSLPVPLLKALAVCTHVIVWNNAVQAVYPKEESSILIDLIRVPFLREQRYMDHGDLLSYAITVLWGFEIELFKDLGVLEGDSTSAASLGKNKQLVANYYEFQTSKIHQRISHMLNSLGYGGIRVFEHIEPVLKSLLPLLFGSDITYSTILSRFEDGESDEVNFEKISNRAKMHALFVCIGDQRGIESIADEDDFWKGQTGRGVLCMYMCQLYLNYKHKTPIDDFLRFVSPTRKIVTDAIREVVALAPDIAFDIALAWTEAVHFTMTDNSNSCAININDSMKLNLKMVLDSLLDSTSTKCSEEQKLIIKRVMSELAMWGVKWEKEEQKLIIKRVTSELAMRGVK